MKHIIDDADKNKYEAYTKQEVLEVIQEAISSGELPEEINGLVLTFKNPVDNQAYKIAFCTQAKYNELEAGGLLEANCVYYITDDTSYDDLMDAIDDLEDMVEACDGRITTNANNIAANTSDINGNTTEILNIKNNVSLYRHDIKYTKASYFKTEIHFTLYLKTATPITSVGTIFDMFGADKEINAVGYVNIDPYSTTDLTKNRSIYKIEFDQVGSTKSCYLYYVAQQSGDIGYVGGMNYNESVSDNVTKVFDLSDLITIDNPTYITEFDYEDSGWDYNKIIVTNPNNQAATLYYRVGSSGAYTSVSIGANETYNIGTYQSMISGTMYLEINGISSEVVNWVS